MKLLIGLWTFSIAIVAGHVVAQTRSGYVAPLAGSPVVTAHFGAFGPGPATDPKTYFSGQYHLGVDLKADPGVEVRSPVSGSIIYYHQLRNSPREVRLLDTFVVIRGDDGRDYILAHINCTACAVDKPIGDDGAYPKKNWRTVAAGDVVGKIADLKGEANRLGLTQGIGNHLHLGVVQGQMIDDTGMLKTAYRGGNWSRLLYDKSEDADPVTARAQAKANGFLEPLAALKETPKLPAKAAPVKPQPAKALAPAPTAAPPAAQAAPLQPLNIGAFVYHEVACGDASNSSLQWWNGEFFSAGRMTNVYPVYVSPGKYRSRVKDFETGQMTTVAITVLNPNTYLMGSVRFKFCPDRTLPPTWRNSTPPRGTRISTAPAAAPAAAAPAALTVIRGAPTGGCTLSFDQQRRQIFAHTWTDGWRAGIGGATNFFRQSDSRYDSRTGAYTMFSRDRQTAIRVQPTGRSVSLRSYDAEMVEVTLTVRGTASRTNAYRICPPGD